MAVSERPNVTRNCSTACGSDAGSPRPPTTRASNPRRRGCFQQVEEVSETIWRLPSERTLRLVRLAHSRTAVSTLIFSDITPELRLKSQFNHLIQVQRATLDKLSDAVAVFGADGRLKLHNEAFESVLGDASGCTAERAGFRRCRRALHSQAAQPTILARPQRPDHRSRSARRASTVERRDDHRGAAHRLVSITPTSRWRDLDRLRRHHRYAPPGGGPDAIAKPRSPKRND